MVDLTVRHAREDDASAMAVLVGHLGYDVCPAATRSRLREALSCHGHEVFVAVESGDVVGFLHCFTRVAIEKGPELVVQAMVVRPGHRNKGAATMLLTAAESFARSVGCEAVALHSRSDRDAAHRFYTGRGYAVAASSSLFRKPID